MESVILVIHLFLALAIIGLVLLQRSEGGGLGIGGGGMGGLTTARGAANMLTRATAICAGAFFATSLLLGILAGAHTGGQGKLLESLPAATVEGQAPAVDAEEDATAEEDKGGAQEQKDKEAPTAPVAE